MAQQRVDAEEVGSENAVGLGGEELAPGGADAARGGIDAGPFENRPHRTGPDLEAQSRGCTFLVAQLRTLLYSINQ